MRISDAIAPREWQVEAVARWRDSGFRGVVKVVTGAGKTVFAELCILEFLNSGLGTRVVIIVPTQALLDQWVVTLQDDLGIEDNEIATYSGEEKAGEIRLVNIFVINTARKLARAIASEFDALLIVDEVHRSGSPENSLALQGEWKATLGLSATPEREYDDAFKDVISPAIGDVIYEYDLKRASLDGVISSFALTNVRVELTQREASQFADANRKLAIAIQNHKSGKSSRENIERLLRQRAAISNRAMMRVPTAVRLVEMHEGARTLVFHESIEAAVAISESLNSRGIAASLYHSQLGPVLRRDNLRLFRKGLIPVLVTCRALDEGANVPEASVAVIASATASTRQRIQRFGRVLRKKQYGESASIYTIYATDYEEKRLAQEANGESGAESVRWMKSGRAR